MMRTSVSTVKAFVLAGVVAAAMFGGSPPIAAAAAPAWKLLAVSGPTHIPPLQSEVERVTVEAEGGTFGFPKTGTAELTPVTESGALTTTEGSAVALIAAGAGGTFDVGDRITHPGAEEAPTTVVSCSSDCKTPGSSVTLSNPAQATELGGQFEIFTKRAVTASSTLTVGEEITSGYFPDGTTVIATEPGSVTLSAPTGSGYLSSEGAILVGTRKLTPIPYDAPAGVVQSALEGTLGTGAISVTGGPGGSAEAPYFVHFIGPLSDQDVAELTVEESSLIGQHANVQIFTTVPGGPGTGELTINAANVGGAPTKGEYSVEIGPLPEGIRLKEAPRGVPWTCSEGPEARSALCHSEVSVEELLPAANIAVPIEVTSARSFTGTAPVTISGGGGGSSTVPVEIAISSEPAGLGIAAFWAGAFDSAGEPVTQAGAHPYSADTFFMLNTVRGANGDIIPANGDLRYLQVDLPPGFVGNPLVTPRCPQAQVASEPSSGPGAPCSSATEVGIISPVASAFGEAGSANSGLFNDIPARGYPAEFSLRLTSIIASLLARVRSSEDSGVQIIASNTPTNAQIFGTFAALRGEPRGGNGSPFLTNSASCAENVREAPLATIDYSTWQDSNVSPPSSVNLPAVTGCNLLEFTPSFDVRPTTTSGSSGTGITATLRIPQENLLEPTKLAQPPLKKAVVSLPAGMTLNPSSANGLEACSEAQMGLITTTGELPSPIRFDEEAPRCPDGSKLGTVTVKTPLIDETEEQLHGTIYLAEQEKNPFGSLLAIYLAIESPRFGLEVKLAGEVRTDPATGQLTATFDHNPQLPVEELQLNFRGGGPRSELATPEVCGHYSTTGSLEPWSAPESGPPAQISEPGFDVTTNCSASASARPFAPSFEAGTTGTQAGSYSPLVIKVGRRDGEQELKSLDFTLPKGLLARLAGVPYCPEGAIRNAEGKSGREEQASPSCPAASRIGSVDTSAGVGAEPFHVSGSVYLAGPYKGAPLSSVVVTPAVAGPFDLGDVVIRAPLYVDPETAEVTAKSDPIPTILKGIPLKVRSVAIDLDRPGFSLNPTSCNVMLASAQIGGSDSATAKPSNRFQVGGCDKLGFAPHLKISLKGATKRTGLPALRAVVTYPQGGAYANIQRAQVNLPHSEFLEQDNLNKTCTKPVLLEGKCPAKSIYGRAKAWSPLLEAPLEGPVYLVGGYGYKLPALVAELNGQIRVLLKGKVDSGPNKGIRATFEMVPDAPVSRFVLEMKGGKKYGLLINSEGLCGRKQRANSIFRAQNGLVQHTHPVIANQCGKKGKKKVSGGGKRHGGKKRPSA
jgi:hypothetical protein